MARLGSGEGRGPARHDHSDDRCTHRKHVVDALAALDVTLTTAELATSKRG
jgi:hypothetical protein